MSIVEMAEEESDKRGGVDVLVIYLKLGRLAGVEKEALLSSFELARSGTCLAEARLEIEEVPIEVFCTVCQAPRTLESMQWFVCPECQNPVSEVLHGRELHVVALEIDECPA